MKVAFIGAHGTGKTTLLQNIKQTYTGNLICIEEVARIVIDRGFPLCKNATIDSYVNYINQQLAYENISKDKEYDLLISDRSILDAVAYAQVNSTLPRPYIPHYFIDMLKNIATLESQFFDIFVYFPIEFKLIPDEARDSDIEYKIMIDNQIKTLLEDIKLPFVSINGGIQNRIDTFLQLTHGITNKK